METSITNQIANKTLTQNPKPKKRQFNQGFIVYAFIFIYSSSSNSHGIQQKEERKGKKKKTVIPIPYNSHNPLQIDRHLSLSQKDCIVCKTRT